MSEEISWSTIQKEPVFDSSPLDTLVTALGVEKTIEFTKSYIDACREQAQDVVSALENKDYKKVEFCAHKLSSSTGTYGNKRLHFIYSYIEENCINDTMPEEISTPEQQKDFLNLVDESLKELENHLSQL